MKKLMSLLAFTVLAPIIINNPNILLSEKVTKKQLLNHNEKRDTNPFLNKIFNKNIKKVKFDNKGNIYVGTFNGLYKSIDGINFTLVNLVDGIEPDDININDITFDNNGTIYVATDTVGFYKSTDGTSFESVKCNIPNASLGGVWSLACTDDGVIYASVADGYDVGTGGGLYRSTDGVNFNLVNGINPHGLIYTIAVFNNTVYAGISAKNGSFDDTGLYKSTDGVNFNFVNESPKYLDLCVFDNSSVMYVKDGRNLYKSNDGVNFVPQKNLDFNYKIESLAFDSKNNIYFGTEEGLYKFDLVDKLLKLNQPDNLGNQYNGFVYSDEQRIDIKDNFVKNATFDGNSVAIPSQDFKIAAGEHTLVLSIKEEYQKDFDLFNGIGINQLTYHFWIKTSIDPNQEITYQTPTDNVELRNELISDAGNTQNAAIIQTKSKPTGSYEASLQLLINSDMIDLSNSYFIGGRVDKANNFTATGQKQVVTKNCQIQKEGIYHLYLVDLVGNTYESYLELGYENWLLSGTFNNQALTDLANNLNVTINLVDLPSKHEAFEWLKKYQSAANQAFANSLNVNGKGFKIVIADLPKQYHSFLNPVDYIDSATKFNINQDKLNQKISDLAQQKIAAGLEGLPNLNVDSSNVKIKTDLDNYSNWIKEYQAFITNNRPKWFKELANKVDRGYATVAEIKVIDDYLNHLEFSHYLKLVVWNPEIKLDNKLNNQFQSYVQFDKLESDVIKWVTKKFPDINVHYQNAIKSAESDLNLHGYTLQQLLGNHQFPQTKMEINNYLNSGESFHKWLQSQANINYRSFEIKLCLGIGIPIAVVAFGFGILLIRKYRKNND